MPSECSKHLAPFHQVVCNSAGVRGTFHVARAKKKSFFPPRHQIIFYHALHAIWALFVCTRYLKAGRSPEAILISIYCTVATFVRSPIRTSRGNSLLTEIQREERKKGMRRGDEKWRWGRPSELFRGGPDRGEWMKHKKNVYFTNYDYVMGFAAFSIPTIRGHSAMHRAPHTDGLM